ncbi:MAG: SpoIIE family protein phosphatase [Pyrinomonadaceae bacterium]|nr:SpoIIE family protein phosphatase [Pyrinomonadaceae bacterium]
MNERLRAAGGKAQQTSLRVREWLRRVMPRVGVVAAVLFLLRWFLESSWLYRERHPVALLWEVLTLPVIVFAAIYWGYKALRWLKQRVLWRVRRRLAITYLFVGLTPIVLLLGLGFIFAMTLAVNEMVGDVTSQVGATERQALENSRSLADALAALPTNTNDPALQQWLDERNRYLQASLPGARLALWRANATADNSFAVQQPAQIISAVDDLRTNGFGDQPAVNAPLPEWAKEKAEWSGLTFVTSTNPAQQFAAPALRVVERRATENNGSLILLMTVPVNRALVERYRESTGIAVRPFFADLDRFRYRVDLDNAEGRQDDGERGKMIQIRANDEDATDVKRDVERNDRPVFNSRSDQLGQPLGEGYKMFVVMPATNWLSGKEQSRLAFLMPFSLPELVGRILEKKQLGLNIPLGLVLTVFGIAFLVLEVLALVAGVWMTRAVTGTVHKLYRATEYIKQGDFSHRVNVRSRDQLGELAFAFNDMSANIEGLLTERVTHERLQREVEIAAEVQAQLFPSCVPQLATAEIAGECRAARGVAGDYYDYIEVMPGLVLVALGDVSGKGISASLVMSNLQAALRAQTTIAAERIKFTEQMEAAAVGATVSANANPAQVSSDSLLAAANLNEAVTRIVAGVNEQLWRSTDSNRFATLFIALYDERTQLLRYVNAGHNAPALVRGATGAVESLTTGGMMTGAFEWAAYEEAYVRLERDDLLVIFSDGISEAQNVTGEEYGEDRLVQLAVEHRGLNADDLLREVFDEVDNWSGETERGDDQTLVILKRKN